MKLIAHIEVIRQAIKDMKDEHEFQANEWLEVNEINNALDNLERIIRERLNGNEQGDT